MATYQQLEESDYYGQPVAGVRILVGLDQYAYCLNDADWGHLDVNYQPLAGLEVDGVWQDVHDQFPDVQVTLPFDTPVATRFAAAVSPELYQIELFLGHYGITEGRRIFKGRIIGCDFFGRKVKLICSSELNLAQTLALRNTFSRRCQWQLYEPDTCGVDPADYTFECFADGVVSGGLVVDSAFVDTLQDGYLDGGTIKRLSTGDWRMVLTHVGTTMTLMAPFPTIQPGETIEVRAGCDHQISTCDSKFNNKRRCGCWANVPNKNPYLKKIS